MAEIISFSSVGWLLKRISESERQQVSKSFYAARKSTLQDVENSKTGINRDISLVEKNDERMLLSVHFSQ